MKIFEKEERTALSDNNYIDKTIDSVRDRLEDIKTNADVEVDELIIAKLNLCIASLQQLLSDLTYKSK